MHFSILGALRATSGTTAGAPGGTPVGNLSQFRDYHKGHQRKWFNVRPGYP